MSENEANEAPPAEGRLVPDYPIRQIDQKGVQRQSVWDVDNLAESIGGLGLLTPVVVTAQGQLICGMRRLAVARQLGWTSIPAWIPATVSDGLRLFAMRDDRALCAPLSPVEQAAMYSEYRELYAEQARLRQAIRFGHRSTRGKKLGRQLPARAHAEFQLTGSQAFQRLEQINELLTIARDVNEDPTVRQAAAESLVEIDYGVSVCPAWGRVKQQQAPVSGWRAPP